MVLLLFVCLSTCIAAVSSLVFYRLILKDLPTAADLRSHKPHLTTQILDRNGIALYNIYRDENRSLVALADIPQSVIDATISIEDKDFYQHRGVSIRGIIRALRSIVQDGVVQGGSTITQQLIKNTVLTREKTLVRKIKEALIAFDVERTFTKNEILQMYLNEASYGGSIYGIEQAAKVYFGISARDLSVSQAAFLAGLPAAPSVYSPFGSHIQDGIARQHEVLRRMVEDGKLGSLQAQDVMNQPLVFAKKHDNIKAPHFVFYIKELLAQQYGEDMVSQGGLIVKTTLDYTLQQQAEKIVREEVLKLKRMHVTNGAALITNPQTGEILAMVGSIDYFDSANDGQVNVTVRSRQPGSSIKPLTYATAFERGLTPATQISDTPVTFHSRGSSDYTPKNYDGSYHGTVTARQALANSYNIPAVKVLASIGVEALVEKGKQMGITTWDDRSRFGLSLTLGGGEVKMTDMATVYGTFANAGQTVPLRPIQEVRLYTGEILLSNPCVEASYVCRGRRTLDERIAYQITNILSDNVARSRAFGTHSVLAIPNHQVGVKTGTTNERRDNWTIGFTSNRLVAVWVGNNDNTSMGRVTSGITGASPIWSTLMKKLLEGKPSHAFAVPTGLSTVAMCGSTAACPGECVGRFTEYFLPGTQPTARCQTPTAASQTQHPLQ